MMEHLWLSFPTCDVMQFSQEPGYHWHSVNNEEKKNDSQTVSQIQSLNHTHTAPPLHSKLGDYNLSPTGREGRCPGNVTSKALEGKDLLRAQREKGT